MRVIETAVDPLVASAASGSGRSRLAGAHAGPDSRARRTANVEALGLMACSLVILFGLWVTAWGRIEQLRSADRDPSPVLNLRTLRSPNDLLPLLTMFDDRIERQAAARALYRRAVSDDPPLDHVGGLTAASLGADEIRRNPHFVELRARLARRPGAAQVAVLSPADLAVLKPRVVVRTLRKFARDALLTCGIFLSAFWIAHFVRRWRRAEDDPLMLPILLLLSGIGLMCMLALRDPIRDTMPAETFAIGVAMGLAALVAAAEFDFEASPLRRAFIAPLGLALALASLLLVFGSGPGSSGAKVNLLGFQPVEVIRLLVVFALAAYFARRLERLRELSEPATPAHPWLGLIRMPRWIDVRPVVVSMLVVLAFFFLQKDLGPALVLTGVVLALYAIARGRSGSVALGLAMLVAGFSAAYLIGLPATVRQRVLIWLDPWNNGVPGGNQIAYGLWAMATGAVRGSSPGFGSPQSIPAGHTDFVLAAIGEQLGFIGLALVLALYVMLTWRCLRAARHAPGDFTALLATGATLALVVQALVIASGVLGLFPLSGVVTPFLSFGRSSMIANGFAVGVVMAVARRRGPVRAHLDGQLRTLAAVLSVAAIGVLTRAGWVQIVKADRFATAASLTEQADGGYRFEYNPRLVAAAKQLERGTIYDRNGLVLATSRPAQVQAIEGSYRQAGVTIERPCAPADARCYPFGGVLFSVLGDWEHQTNWGARNSSYVERDSDTELKGFDDRQRVVEVMNPRTGARDRTIKRDYSELLPLVRVGADSNDPKVRALMTRPRDVRTTIDARLQSRVAMALRKGIAAGAYTKGAAIVLDVETGELLASVSYPWPTTTEEMRDEEMGNESGAMDAWLDRPRYGLYPPGSTFKILVASAALRSNPAAENESFACVRLPGGRVGNHLRGWSRPVRDDPLDTVPHGQVTLRRGLVVSCNAYFAQLALRLGPRPILDAASFFQIDAAHPDTPAALRRTLPYAGYGQADVLVSPLKMARVAAAVAAGGRVLPVRWLAAAGSADKEPAARFLSPSAAKELSDYMREVVTSGTGRILLSNATPIAGKTGTAEVDHGRAHSWFAGFAPAGGSHPIAFAVIVENAGYGARAAAPIAGEIVNAARDLGMLK